jgi:hypothetical protein
LARDRAAGRVAAGALTPGAHRGEEALGGRPFGSRQARGADAEGAVIRKLSSGEYRLYSRKKDPRTGKRRNLGTFKTRKAALAHERAVQFFKRRA